MFKHVVALNTYTEPFLSLKANDQRTLIEQLLGITLLSEKADALKEQIKATRDAISQEEFRIKAVTDANKRIEEQIENLRKRQQTWNSKHADDMQKLETALGQLLEIDITAEIEAHKALAEYNKKKKDISDLQSYISRCQQDEVRENRLIEKLKKEIAALEDHKCHACGQELHDDQHETALDAKKKELQEAALQALATNGQWIEHTDTLKELGPLGTKPKTFYNNESDAIHHKATVTNLHEQVVAKSQDVDPYTEQIKDMSEQALQEITYDLMNNLTNVKEHQEFLLKLLTNKDSFIRKRIIDQNLSYLNARLGQYLDRIGLPHTVKFNNDLTVAISELGRDLDFDNLSRGERNRLILGLSWAFRDVYESMNEPINFMAIDELIDSGMDTNGVDSALSVLKKIERERGKNIFLISHRDELVGRVNTILQVTKENGFTTFSTDTEYVSGT
jgi:DNA repair exonuclease SbcCD ATPase subunit